MTEENQKIAQTILTQLGGSKFVAMTGAKDFVAIERGLMFKIGRGAANKANKVIVRLNANDLYDVEYGRLQKLEWKVKDKAANLYADQLQRDFTERTGFDTHL